MMTDRRLLQDFTSKCYRTLLCSQTELFSEPILLLYRLLQTETLSSLKALLKHIDQTQLTRDLEGTFHYDHDHWIHFRQVGEKCCDSRRDKDNFLMWRSPVSSKALMLLAPNKLHISLSPFYTENGTVCQQL